MIPMTWPRRSTLALAAAALVAPLVASCSGTSVDFQGRFDGFAPGVTRSEALAQAGTPLATQSFDVAGFQVSWDEYADLRSRYVLVFAGSPMNEPRLIAKRQLPHLACK